MTGFIKTQTPETTPIVPTDFRHALCVGETGCGKTTSFILPNIKARLERGHGMLVVDYKGSLHSQLKVLAGDTKRLKEVLEVGVPWGTKINIFAGVSRALFLDTLEAVIDKDKNDIWTSSAIGLAGRLYDALALMRDLEEMTAEVKEDTKEIFLSGDYTLSAASFIKIIGSKKSLEGFTSTMQVYIDYLSDENLMAWYEKRQLAKAQLGLIREFRMRLFRLENELSDFHEEIDTSSPASGNGGVLFSLRGLMGLFGREDFNGEADLKTLLESSQVVILRSDAFDKKLLAAVMNILYQRLLVRENDTPITLVVDEFQRTVSERNFPYVDVFREMKVELIAAMQNINQLKNRLDEEGAEELLANIIHNYSYADHRENSLKTFEFMHSSRKAKAIPLFLTPQRQMTAQKRWQKIHADLLEEGWVFKRSLGYKKVVIEHTKTKERRNHFLLFEKDRHYFDELCERMEAKKRSEEKMEELFGV